MKKIILSFFILLAALHFGQNKLVCDDYSISLPANFNKYVFSLAEKSTHESSSNTFPADFFMYTGNLNDKFLSVAFWVADGDFELSNKVFKEVFAEQTAKDEVILEMKKHLPSNSIIKFSEINLVSVITTNYKREGEIINTVYIYENGKQYNLLVKYNDPKYQHTNNKIISSLRSEK